MTAVPPTLLLAAILFDAGLVAGASGQPRPAGSLFVDAAASLNLADPAARPTSGAALRQRLVRVDHGVLDVARRTAEGSAGQPAVLEIDLFDDVVFRAVVDRTGPTSSGYWLAGRIEGYQFGSLTLVVNGDIVVGAVRVPGAAYAISPAGDGTHAVSLTEPLVPQLGPDDVASPSAAPRGGRVRTRPTLPGEPPAPVPRFGDAALAARDQGDARIGVLVVYTSNGRSEIGGRDEIEARIDFAIVQTNIAYADSGVIQRIHLAQAVEVDYVSDGETGTDLNRLIDPADGHMDGVHAQRDRYDSDLVHLLVPVSDAIGRRGRFDAGGRATLGPGADAAFSMCTMLRPDATNWVTWQPYCLAHELGHNMGLLHDRWDHRGSDLTASLHPYSYGYVNQRAFEPDAPMSSRWYTIMGQHTQCTDWSEEQGDEEFSCESVLRFANPDLLYNGDPTGVHGDSPSASVDGPANAARSLNETWRIVAAIAQGAPVAVAGALPDRRLALGVTLNVNVSRAFADPDDDALTYSVSSSAPRVVAARATDARVTTLTAVGEGRATIRVTATDPGGLSAMQSFTVTVSTRVSSFTDDPLQPGVTPVKAVHFTELRTRIDALRSAAGLLRFSWTDPVLRAGVTRVRRVHLLELRSALAEAYRAAGRAAPRWTDATPAARSTPVRAVHLTELRAAVLALE